MTDNRSLDDFLAGDSADAPESDGDGPATDDAPVEETSGGASVEGAPAGDARAEDAVDSDGADESSDPDSEAEAAVGTYRWDPDGVDCPVCGETVERLWLDDDRQVCADCKAW